MFFNCFCIHFILVAGIKVRGAFIIAKMKVRKVTNLICITVTNSKAFVSGNTGFYYVRGNENTVKLWNAVIKDAPNRKDMDDQTIFWE